jgi:hypothetical protein
MSVVSKIIVHCGFHKTGSSSIQQFFRLTDSGLDIDGIFYPVFINPLNGSKYYNHSAPIFSAYSGKFESYHINLKLKFGLIELESMNYEFRKQLREQLQQSSMPTFLLSGEDISMLSQIELEEFVGTIKESIATTALEIQAFVYVRSPLNLYVSEIQQSVKGGLTIEDAIEKRRPLLGRAVPGKLNILRQVFGSGLRIARFEDAVSCKGGVVKHFLDENKISVLRPDVDFSEYRVNESFSYEALELLSEVNRELPLFIDGKLNDKREGTDFRLFGNVSGVKFSISRKHQDVCWSKSSGCLKYLEDEFGITYSFEGIDEASPEWSDQSIRDLVLIYKKLSKDIRKVIFNYLKKKCMNCTENGEEISARYFMAVKAIKPESHFVKKYAL